MQSGNSIALKLWSPVGVCDDTTNAPKVSEPSAVNIPEPVAAGLF